MTEQTAMIDLTLDPRLSETSFVDYTWNWPTAIRAAICLCDYLAEQEGGEIAPITPVSISMDKDGQLNIAPVEQEHATPFLAPEVRDGGPASPASQVYNVGSVLYCFLLGYPPLGNVRNIDQDAPDTPAELRRVMFHALAIEPADRIATVKELRAKLYSVLSPATWGKQVAPKLPLDDQAKARLEAMIDRGQQRWLQTRDKIPWQRVGKGQRRLAGTVANPETRKAITIVGMVFMIVLYLSLFTNAI